MRPETARRHLQSIAETAHLDGFYSLELPHRLRAHTYPLKHAGYLSHGERKLVLLPSDHGNPQKRGVFAITDKGRALLGLPEADADSPIGAQNGKPQRQTRLRPLGELRRFVVHKLDALAYASDTGCGEVEHVRLVFEELIQQGLAFAVEVHPSNPHR